MEHIKNSTKLIGIKDLNIKISIVLKHQTRIEIRAELDYPAPACP
ncbi:MAG: ISL3 family transposase, partial [Streptococcus hyointestinalis]|nr:ISL3 family transposase [Streptococcus hyointestinalis]MDD6384634.1 ISL3 family transposase [Streptococcus hyointestinalis]